MAGRRESEKQKLKSHLLNLFNKLRIDSGKGNHPYINYRGWILDKGVEQFFPVLIVNLTEQLITTVIIVPKYFLSWDFFKKMIK